MGRCQLGDLRISQFSFIIKKKKTNIYLFLMPKN